MTDEEQLAVQIGLAVVERQAAGRELAGYGINASPADISAYLAMSQRQRQAANTAWAIYVASMDNPG